MAEDRVKSGGVECGPRLTAVDETKFKPTSPPSKSSRVRRDLSIQETSESEDLFRVANEDKSNEYTMIDTAVMPCKQMSRLTRMKFAPRIDGTLCKPD